VLNTIKPLLGRPQLKFTPLHKCVIPLARTRRSVSSPLRRRSRELLADTHPNADAAQTFSVDINWQNVLCVCLHKSLSCSQINDEKIAKLIKYYVYLLAADIQFMVWMRVSSPRVLRKMINYYYCQKFIMSGRKTKVEFRSLTNSKYAIEIFKTNFALKIHSL
jgi:hypothetical protein